MDLNCTARVYRNIGRLYALNGSMDDAIRFFKQSLAVDPESVESYHYLADALAEKGDLREAIASYEGALDLEPRDPETCWDCALALQLILKKMGSNELVLRYVRSVLRYAAADLRGLELLSKMGGAVSKSGPTQSDSYPLQQTSVALLGRHSARATSPAPAIFGSGHTIGWTLPTISRYDSAPTTRTTDAERNAI